MSWMTDLISYVTRLVSRGTRSASPTEVNDTVNFGDDSIPPSTCAHHEFSDDLSTVVTGELTDKEAINFGSTAVVYKALNSEGKPVAIKQLIAKHTTPALTENEHKIWQQMQHPHVIQMFLFNPTDLYFVMEYAKRGDLFTKVAESEVGLDWQRDIIPMATQISAALCYLKELSVIHRDLKLDNIVIMSDGTYKLTDFGEAVQLSDAQDHLTEIKGTPVAWSPEMLWLLGYDFQTDVFALGNVLYQALTASGLYDNKVKPEEVIPYLRNPAYPDVSELKPKMQYNLHRLWLRNPNDRPDIETVHAELSGLSAS